MSEILSQSEIDDLLNALTSGTASEKVFESEPVAKEAKDYNFKRPSKFNKEQLRTLEIIFDNYARITSSFLSGYLRTSVNIDVVNAEQLTYSEFNNSLVNPVILSIIDLKPLKGSVIMEMSSNLGYSIIDRVLGGPGNGLKRLRDFSEIEVILLERIITQMINLMVEPWENVIQLEPALEKIETNSQFAQIISANDMTALITLSIKVGSVEGFLNFCIPHIVIEPIMKKLNTRYWFAKTDYDEDSDVYKKELEGRLETAKVDVSAVIGRTYITVLDFLQLQEGDIIPLDSFIDSDLDIVVGNLLKFKGKPGLVRGKNAIQVTAHVRKEE